MLILMLFLCGTIAAVFLPADQSRQWPMVYSIVGVESPLPMQASGPEARTRTVSEPMHQRRNQTLVHLVAAKLPVQAPPPAVRGVWFHPQEIVPLSPELPESSPRAPPSVC